jgi:hypothetical protein
MADSIAASRGVGTGHEQLAIDPEEGNDMANRGKHFAKSDDDLFDAARPGERFDDELDEMDELYEEREERRRAAGEEGGVLGEGELVGPWSEEEDEEPNAFDAASELDEEQEEEEDLDESEFETLDDGSVTGEPTDRHRRDH